METDHLQVLTVAVAACIHYVLVPGSKESVQLHKLHLVLRHISEILRIRMLLYAVCMLCVCCVYAVCMDKCKACKAYANTSRHCRHCLSQCFGTTYDFIVPPREVQPASKAAFELDQCSKGSCGHWDQMMVATWSWRCGLLWLEMWYFVPLHYQFQCSGIVLGRSCGEQCKCC